MMADVMERMNYAALKRVDPYVKDIIDTATHVALYTFNGDFSEWERTDVEGALFVYSRSGEPYHGVLIMNRLNTNNLVEPILQGLEFQLQEPFLLYRNPRSRIYGIWFYEKDECVRIATVLDKLVKEVSNPKKLTMIPSMGNKSSGGIGVDIFSMLSKAQEDFDSNKSSIKNKSVDVKSSVSQSQDAPPQSVVDFFAKASGGASHFTAEKSAKPQALFVNHPARTALLPDGSDGNNFQPLLQRLMSNPAHSVEHIEKQQRSVTPNTEISTASRNKAKQQISDGIKAVNDGNIKLRPISCSNVCEKPGRLVLDSTQTKNLQEQQHMKNSGALDIENGMNILRISSPNSTGSLPPPFFGGTVPSVPVVDCSTTDRPLSAPLCSNAETQKVALMPPTMFTSSAAKETANLEFVNNVLPLNSKTEISGPVSSSNAMLSSDCSIPIKPEPLTKNQLLQAVTYLLKNDPDFVHKLHEAYVKSFSELVH
ncbi:mRNA-decapping enzyme 1A [Schistocerca cancellata]|uniref:mRNA-decapping enzyme 1A n=1 Tax=Schistocerca cancellata TaxID=274614 RepID=UPI0021180A78|nr:mRNA-decapping enzyme 1A [Schistocerca cancellata]